MFRKLILITAVFMLFTGTAFSQEEEANELFRLDLAAGTSFSLVGEDTDTFKFDNVAGLVHANVLGVEFLDVTSGVGLEVNFGGEVEYTVWSLNRAVIPGTNNRLYAGTDLKVLQSDGLRGAEGDFDLRLVSGTNLGNVGPGELKFELYFIEENRPISFAVLYNFDF